MITLASNPGGQTVTIDQGTDAITRDTLYFTGISTNLNVGDALLIVSGQGAGQQSLRIVESVSAQADQQRTEVTLQEALPTLPSERRRLATGGHRVAECAGSIYRGCHRHLQWGRPGNRGGDHTPNTHRECDGCGARPDSSAADIAALILPVIPPIQQIHAIAAQRGFTRLEPWISDILNMLASLLAQIPSLHDSGEAR